MIQMSKKMKWICGLGAFVLMAALFSMCSSGSGEKKSSSEEQHQNESREMAASTLKLKGSHASLFKVEEPYLLRLVKTQDKGWQVRAKINFVKVKDIDTKNYQQKVKCCPEMAYMDDCDVELQEGQLSSDYFNTLCAQEVGEPEEIILQPFNWDPMSYEAAKKIYDATRYVVITDMDLDAVEKNNALLDATKSILEDDDVQELQDAAETAGKLLEAEKELLDALF